MIWQRQDIWFKRRTGNDVEEEMKEEEGTVLVATRICEEVKE